MKTTPEPKPTDTDTTVRKAVDAPVKPRRLTVDVDIRAGGTVITKKGSGDG